MDAGPTNYSLSIDCTPSNFHTNFKAYLFIALTIDWFKIMVMFYCTFGYQRNDTVFGSKHLRVSLPLRCFYLWMAKAMNHNCTKL